MRGLFLCMALWSAATAGQTTAGEAASNPPGLSVRRGMLTLGDKPFRGIGVNYFSMFSRLLKDPKDDSSLTNLVALGKANIPFVRFMCGGYWPAEQRFYLTNREVFFQRLDRVIQCAEQNHIGLVRRRIRRQSASWCNRGSKARIWQAAGGDRASARATGCGVGVRFSWSGSGLEYQFPK